MEKNTLIAVILSVIVITASFAIQGILFPPDTTQVENPQFSGEQLPQAGENETGSGFRSQQTMNQAEEQTQIIASVLSEQDEIASDEIVTYQNDFIRVLIDPRGARIISLQLLQYEDAGSPLEMVVCSQNGPAAFDISFGGPNQPPVRDLFIQQETSDENVLEFYRDFQFQGEAPFRLIRRYRFVPGEYIFKVETELQNSVNQLLPLQQDGVAYTLHYGPQIGPNFDNLDGRSDFRRFVYFDRKRHDEKLDQGEYFELTERVRWAGINGKYFAAIAIPGSADYQIIFDTRGSSPLSESHSMYLVRPTISSATNVDSVVFYAGPKIESVMNRYDRAENNALGLSGLDLEEVQDSRMLGWFEKILKSLLDFIYGLIPNYGVAIIIMTILVKLALWPLTKKSFESNAKSQALQPKIAELRAKYSDKPEKLNAEMMELYRKEGVNPLGGCLPMLFQMPLLLAMFGLFNNDFDLRGATFIAGWIGDLSSPESILYFGDLFKLPILGWTDIRLLPIIFVLSQLLFGRFTQPAGTGSNSQAKMLTTFMPIMFFFILYNMPSGLLLYWIVTNILSVVQQVGTTKYRQGHPQHENTQEKK